MSWKEFAADYLGFSHRDRIAILAIQFLILVVFLLPKLVPSGAAISNRADTGWIAALERLRQHENVKKSNGRADNEYAYQNDGGKNNSRYRAGAILFYFDPNSLSATGWEKLGLRTTTIHTIQHYLEKGGRFKKPEDLRRIYGLRQDEYERLVPFIRIQSPGSLVPAVEQPAPPIVRTVTSARKNYVVIDINTADTTDFISLPGIGNKLAARILNFREKLGGFYSINQVGETFGLPDSTFGKIKQFLKLGNPSTRKIPINTASMDELKAHPYIRYNLAKPIIAYRDEHGPFEKIEDLKKVMAVTEQVFEKLKYYLSID